LQMKKGVGQRAPQFGELGKKGSRNIEERVCLVPNPRQKKRRNRAPRRPPESPGVDERRQGDKRGKGLRFLEMPKSSFPKGVNEGETTGEGEAAAGGGKIKIRVRPAMLQSEEGRIKKGG